MDPNRKGDPLKKARKMTIHNISQFCAKEVKERIDASISALESLGTPIELDRILQYISIMELEEGNKIKEPKTMSSKNSIMLYTNDIKPWEMREKSKSFSGGRELRDRSNKPNYKESVMADRASGRDRQYNKNRSYTEDRRGQERKPQNYKSERSNARSYRQEDRSRRDKSYNRNREEQYQKRKPDKYSTSRSSSRGYNNYDRRDRSNSWNRNKYERNDDRQNKDRRDKSADKHGNETNRSILEEMKKKGYRCVRCYGKSHTADRCKTYPKTAKYECKICTRGYHYDCKERTQKKGEDKQNGRRQQERQYPRRDRSESSDRRSTRSTSNESRDRDRSSSRSSYSRASQ